MRGDRPMLNPAPTAFLVRTRNEGRIRVPVISCRRPHGLRLGTDDLERAVSLELLPIAAIDQTPVRPGLGNDCGEIAHAARTAGTPIVAVARRPDSIFAPAALTCSSVTASSCWRTSAGSTKRPYTASWRDA